ncbi:MAG: BGTF surface domain-containing protein [Haloquadratum sp.]
MSHLHTLTTLAAVFSLVCGGAVPVAGLGAASSGAEAEAGAGAAPPTATAGALGGAGTVAQADDASASFTPGNVTVVRGNEVTITVSHSATANVTIGGPEYGFHVTVTLGGGGTDEIVLDTRATTAADPTKFIEGGNPTLHSAPLEESIEPAKYLLRVEIDGVEYDLGTLTVKPRGETTVDAYRAPESFTPDEYVGGGEEGGANVGPLESIMSPGSTVARGDYAVLQFHESGLETALNASDLTGSDAANGLKLNFTQTTPGPNHRAREYVATETANVSVLPNFGGDEFYVLWNTSGVPLEQQSERNRYRATLALTDASGLVEEPTTLAATTFTLREPTVSLAPVNDSVHYPWENRSFRVAGRTNLAPNTTLEVRLRSADPNAFLQLREATVGSEGRYRTAFDLGVVSRGTNATLWVRNYFLQTKQEVYIVAPDPSVRIRDQTVNGTAVTVASAEVPAGGFVVLEDAGGEPVGRSEYLPPGRHTNVSAELSVPLFETQTIRATLVRAKNGSYDPNASAYTTNGTVVNDTARIDFPQTPTETSTPTPTPTPTPTATPTPTPTPFPVVTRTPLAPAASQSNMPLSPGVTIAAVLGAAALLARRGDAS